MVSAVQAKRMIKPFLLRHPDFIMIQRHVLKVPFDRIVSGFFIETTGRHYRFFLYEQYAPLVMAYDNMPVGITRDRRPPRPHRAWDTNWPHEEMLLDLVLERFVLPGIETTGTFEALIARDEQGEFSTPFAPFMRHLSYAARIRAVQGRFDEAEALCADFEVKFALRMDAYRGVKQEIALQEPPVRRKKSDFRGRVSYPEPVISPRDRISLDLLWPALQSRDKPRIAALLHGWEAESVKNMKLEQYWQPTPFEWE